MGSPDISQYRGTASANVPSLLTKVQGKGLLDPSCRPFPSNDLISMCPPELPSIRNLNTTIAAFMESLKVTADKIHQIERDTRDQRHSALWYWLRRYRITSSMFGEVLHRKVQTPPDSLVLKIIQQKRFTSAATEWGILNKPVAIQQYINYQRAHGHESLVVTTSGLLVIERHPFFGATPDGAVHDPSHKDQPFGFLEVKMPIL